MITVMGAAGNTGSQIARRLLAAGERVRVISRSASKLGPLVAAGAEAAIGDANDVRFLTRAFRGADACYVMLAPDISAPDYAAAQDAMGESIRRALADSGVRRVAALSSIGADKTIPTGVVSGLHRQEQRLRELLDVHLCLLRPASFFENLTPQILAAGEAGYIADIIDPDLPVPMVAVRDIARAAARKLSSRDWRGEQVLELMGPRDVTHGEIAAIVGRVLGAPQISYVRLAEDQLVEGLQAAGASASFARLYVELARAINRRDLDPVGGRTRENTTPTEFEDFVREAVAAR